MRKTSVSYDKAIELQPDFHLAWNNRGNTLLNLERFIKVSVFYDQAFSNKARCYALQNNAEMVLVNLYNAINPKYKKYL